MAVSERPALLVGLFHRQRWVVVGSLLLVVLLSWLYLLTGAGMDMSAWDMTAWPAFLSGSGNEMAGMAGEMAAWDVSLAVVMFFMWWIMMIAMMLPSAAPLVLLYARVNARERQRGRDFVPIGFFASGYLIAWAGFSALAVTLQWGLESWGQLSAMMGAESRPLAGGLLILAGLYQLTPLKQACLKHCRSPIDYLSRHWRKGAGGGFMMGLQHGAYCLGCCWVLMLLLFVGGVMNLLWITGLALYVLAEKFLPGGPWISRGFGLVLILGGGWLLASA